MTWYNPYRTYTGEPVSATGYVVRFPTYILWSVWGFLVSWFETRNFRRLWQGLPAIALAGVLGLLFVRLGRPASNTFVVSYQEKAAQATRAEDYELADFYFRKLQQLAPGDARVRYDHALMLAARGDTSQAAHLMQLLLQDNDHTDDTKVHLWLARTSLEGKLDVEDPTAFAKSHLNQVLEAEPANRFAHFFYAQLFLRLNDPDNAIRHLEPIAAQSPEIQMDLAKLYRLKGDTTRSASLAREAMNVLEREVQDAQATDVNLWLRLADCQLLLNNYEAAVATLKQALTKFDSDVCRKALGRVYVAWSDDVFASSPDQVGRRMELLQAALQVAPDEPAALQRIVDVSVVEGPAADDARTALQEALAEGRGTAVIHFALGTAEAAKGNLEKALHHLNQAQAVNPHTAVTLNNLAYVLAHMATPDLNRALELSNQAVRLAPQTASFRETRGQILALMGRTSEAITDLEFALPRTPRLTTKYNIHRTLSTCYAALQDADLARIHENKADELKGRIDVTEPAPQTPTLPVEDVEHILGGTESPETGPAATEAPGDHGE
ncbi:MAG: tetratricopeptide repeat protein [Planctomycetaceae bacterium]|nr:tetratricopeptide repeat protein [Planctomycetaceae bacterium]